MSNGITKIMRDIGAEAKDRLRCSLMPLPKLKIALSK